MSRVKLCEKCDGWGKHKVNVWDNDEAEKLTCVDCYGTGQIEQIMSNELIVSNEFIRKIALDNGFELKAITESRQDLKPYVYEFARALIAAVLDPDQAIRDKLDSHNDKLRDNQS